MDHIIWFISDGWTEGWIKIVKRWALIGEEQNRPNSVFKGVSFINKNCRIHFVKKCQYCHNRCNLYDSPVLSRRIGSKDVACRYQSKRRGFVDFCDWIYDHYHCRKSANTEVESSNFFRSQRYFVYNSDSTSPLRAQTHLKLIFKSFGIVHFVWLFQSYQSYTWYYGESFFSRTIIWTKSIWILGRALH